MSEHLLPLLLDVRRATRGGVEAIAERQRRRFVDIVRHARTHSPYYRRLYAHLPDIVEDPGVLPVTDKKALMAHFDEWATDRDVTLEKAASFAETRPHR